MVGAARQLRASQRAMRNWCREALRDAIVNPVAGAAALPHTLRLAVLRGYGVQLGDCRIFPGCWFGGRDVAIGDGTFVNRGCWFENSARIAIGRRCAVGIGTLILTSTHLPGEEAARAGRLVGRPVLVGDGVWIGARATLLPGVIVGEGCVVAAGAVVARDCEPHGLYAGVPARRIRDLA